MMIGSIWVGSDIDQGSIFHFTVALPLSESFSEDDSASLEALKGKRVLIVSERSINRGVLMHAISDWGMEASSAEVLQEALALLGSPQCQPFEAMVLDVGSPSDIDPGLSDRIQTVLGNNVSVMLLLPSAAYDLESTCARDAVSLECFTTPARQSDLRNALLKLTIHKRPDDQKSSGLAEKMDPKRSLKILLAEDNEVNQVVAEEMLQLMGHRVQVVPNGWLAVLAVGRDGFDLIFMDVQMPEIGGHEATRAIRRIEGKTGHHTPIIAMTAHALLEDQQRCLDEGMDDYISKPINSARLSEVLHRWSMSPEKGKEPAPEQKES
jgi:two-component system, sensor histidine kinase and response regulator